MRNEVRFYSEFPELKERGVRYPMVYGVEDQLEKVTGQLGGAVPEEPSDLSKCGALLWMEPVLGYDQGSPLPADKSALILSAVARLHSASWEDTNLLKRASERLQHPGGSFALKIRNPAELEEDRSQLGDLCKELREGGAGGLLRQAGGFGPEAAAGGALGRGPARASYRPTSTRASSTATSRR